VTNTGKTGVNVTSFSVDNPAVFQLTQGIAPVKLNAGSTTHYTIVFAPQQAQSYSGNFTVHIDNGQVLTASLSGTGVISTAQATLSTNLLDFGTVTQGQNVPKQTVTITNSGTQSLKLDAVVVDAPFSTNFITTVTIGAGRSFQLNVTLNPTTVGTLSSLIVLCYDSVPAQGVTLKGNVSAAPQLAVTNFPFLPDGTQGAAYLAYLAAEGGTAPYSWKLKNGTTLPNGLSVDSAGTVTGTVSSSAGTGPYNFTLTATDSSVPPKSISKPMQMQIKPPTGAACNNISWNVTGTNSPILGLDVLGTGTYLGAEGGLYPDGSNIRPDDHTNYGIGLAQQVQPLDANGNPDPNGKEVLITLGESNVNIEAGGFAADAAADPLKNPSVVVVNAGIGDATAAQLSDPNSPFWTTIINYVLPNYGVTAKQVVASWAEPDDGLNSGTFPSDIGNLQNQIEDMAQNILTLFPNVKLAYFSSRIYSGYSNGISTTNPEPYAFEDSFAVKWSIQDQLDGAANLNFDPSKGPVLAPWMSWGPYLWADGMLIPSNTGYIWDCQNIKFDGTHPSTPGGKEQVASQVLNFFKTDPTASPWFVAP
jgi:hypothetical protein